MRARWVSLLAGAVLVWFLQAPVPVGATKGFTDIIKQRKEASKGGGGNWGGGKISSGLEDSGPELNPMWFAYGLGGVLTLVLVAYLYNRRNASRVVPVATARLQEHRQNFKQHAMALGFKIRETRMLRKMALRISPQMPANLLTTPSGREYLIGDLQSRIDQREREIVLLQGLYDKLGKISAQKIHERESVRVEADLSIWIVRRDREVIAASAGEEEMDEIDPAAGQMQDISEGGAAIAVDLDVQRGDTVEFWSADSEVWIPPVLAGVVHVRPAQGETPPILHLHFLDPPAELRVAIQELQQRSERGIAAD